MFRRGRTGTRTGAHPCVWGSDPAARRNPLRLCPSRLVSGLRSRPFGPARRLPGRTVQWPLPRLSLHHRCGGSAGIWPASQFSIFPSKTAPWVRIC